MCAAGGQGAPLVPVYHRALAARLPERPLALVNIGGVANVTWIGRDGALIAFDTGPGNALIDDWMARHTGRALDDGRQGRRRGRVDEDSADRAADARLFRRGCRRSRSIATRSRSMPVAALSVEDGAATLTAFTATAIARAREHFPEEPRAVGDLRRRPPQPHADEHDRRAGRVRRGAGRGGRLRRRRARGGGVGLSRRALAHGPADHLSRHHRRRPPP